MDEQCHIEVRLLPLKNCHGAIWHLDGEWVIQLKESDSPAMRRFILFHEAFHILTRIKINHALNETGIKGGSFDEMIADSFAISILLPVKWVREQWAEVQDLDKMAKIFDVPKAALCARLRRLGLIQKFETLSPVIPAPLTL